MHTENSVRINQHTCGTLIADLVDALSLLASTSQSKDWKEVRALIFRMVAENPTWGAPRIHGELLKLGFELLERSVSRWIRRAPRNPDPVKRWLTFLRNHREAIAVMDFFTVPTLTFGVLYCFFVIGHDRRKILYFNVMRNPNALWVVQQLREGLGPTDSRTDSCYSTATQSLQPRCFRR